LDFSGTEYDSPVSRTMLSAGARSVISCLMILVMNLLLFALDRTELTEKVPMKRHTKERS